jgi:DNA modification methylase
MLYATQEDFTIEDFETQPLVALDKREELNNFYKDKLSINKLLNRSLISFQANKSEPFYRWFKYKEGFSTAFVKYILNLFGEPYQKQVVLDPFSGIGTSLSTSCENGFDAVGIELLPHAVLAINARIASKRINKKQITTLIDQLKKIDFLNPLVEKQYFFKHITITQGAFPDETEISLANFRKFLSERCSDEDIKSLLSLIAISILEDVSYTRKDGQYLRWDYRSGRNLKSKFNKGAIHVFKDRLFEKLENIREDIGNISEASHPDFNLISGSCLYKLQDLKSESVNLVITSPPYCNRYDYTRTYALELAFTGVDDKKIKELRQTLLSATVENKSKYFDLKSLYIEKGKLTQFEKIVAVHRNHPVLSEIIKNLNSCRDVLNNKNIPGMINNYFFEMNFVINELARTLKTGGKVVMVNDNVQYNGNEIPVDLILSDFAREAGLTTEVIWVLEKGKGNSSQQMGIHGRNEIRKCVYVWAKTK